VTEDHDAIEELLAGYVLRSLSGPDAAAADRLLSDHVPSCGGCRRTLEDFQRLASDVGLAVDPSRPPETLLPRLHRQLEPRSQRRRPMRIFAVAAGIAAFVGLAGLSVSQNIRANNADVRADALANAAQIAARPDARMVDVGPVREISAPGVTHLYVVGDGVPAPPAGSVYRVWLVADGSPSFVCEFVPEEGEVFLDVPFDPSRYDDLWIAVEPVDAPTDEPSSARWWSASAADAA
jgi:hypothetical protein